jgi:hypothetical protein
MNLYLDKNHIYYGEIKNMLNLLVINGLFRYFYLI